MATGFYLLDYAPTNGTQWQQWTYPRRGGYRPSGTCIMHTAESALDVIGDDSGAEDCARFIGSRTGSYGSYHSLVDSDSIIEMAPYEYETWQDSETNNWAVGISAACRTTDWATMGDAKREGYYRNLAWCAADFVTYMKQAYNVTVPLVRITGDQARAGVPGFCAHGDSGISRTDPGKDFDWARFFRYTDELLRGSASGTPIPTEQEDDMPLTLVKQPNLPDGTVRPDIWVGNGVQRRKIPNNQTLKDYWHMHNIGVQKLSNGGNIVEAENLDVFGEATTKPVT